MEKTQTDIESHDKDFEKVRAALVHEKNQRQHYEALEKLVKIFDRKYPLSERTEILKELLQKNTKNEVD